MQFQLFLVIAAICVALIFMVRKMLRAIRHRSCDSCDVRTCPACAACQEKKLQEIKPR